MHLSPRKRFSFLFPTRPLRSGRRIGLLQRLFRISSLARQRRQLREMPDHLLKDIGVTRHQAHTEARRPVWDAPDHWKY